uniref:RGS domain-containing protein n=1 Tax=Ciona intestinalis TaxID=7719 RepID=F7AT24_CIOIN
SFDALLSSTAGRFVFRVFLESEIADENLKFWLACENLKSATKQKRIEKGVQDIYDTYINVYSPHEVNIDYKMRENIVDQLKDKMDVSIFTEAQHQIYTLMHRDSYPRFLCSNLTAEITKELVEFCNFFGL